MSTCGRARVVIMETISTALAAANSFFAFRSSLPRLRLDGQSTGAHARTSVKNYVHPLYFIPLYTKASGKVVGIPPKFNTTENSLGTYFKELGEPTRESKREEKRHAGFFCVVLGLMLGT